MAALIMGVAVITAAMTEKKSKAVLSKDEFLGLLDLCGQYLDTANDDDGDSLCSE